MTATKDGKTAITVDEAVTPEEKSSILAPKPKMETAETKVEVTEMTDTKPKITSFSQLDTSGDNPTESKIKPESKEEENKPAEEIGETDADVDEPEDVKKGSEDIKEWLKEVRPDTTKENSKVNGGRMKPLFVGILLLLVVAGVVGGFYYYSTNIKKSDDKLEENEEVSVVEEVTPTPEIVDLKTYSVSVLNGSGIAGEAGRADALLKSAGFENTETGNAEEFDFVATEIAYKEKVPASVLAKIEEALKAGYLTETADQRLAEDAEFDIVITVGSKKASE